MERMAVEPMQKLLGFMRRACDQYKMIEDGDRIAVALSGGKDSAALLTGLVRLRGFLGPQFELVGLTLDPCFGGEETDYTPLTEYCASLGVEHQIKRTEIGRVVFEERNEKHPCSLCARLRRGSLHDAARALGCNKLALGHHRDDAVETFLMNLFIEGRIGCFQPVTYLSRKEITMIRPMVLAPEKDVQRAVRTLEMPVVKSRCPADGATRRQWAKEYLAEMERTDKGFKNRLLGAMQRKGIDGW